MQKDIRGMLRTIRRVIPDEEDAQLLLVIDQFEELFTLVEDQERRTFFLDSLLTAINAPRSPLRVVITLRADFYDRPLQHQRLGELIKEYTEIVLPLTPEELTWAVQEPAHRVGVGFEEGLTPAIVGDLADQPGALPLLQYALTELFERRQDHQMTRADYDHIGGVLGALGRRANEIYEQLDESGREATRQLFLRLITLGEGVEDTRRRVLRSELFALTKDEGRRTDDSSADPPSSSVLGPSSLMDSIIDLYGAARLLTFDHDPATRRPTLEVAHEALLREWGLLRGWLEESRADIRTQRQVTRASAEWKESGRDSSFLIPGGAKLEQFTTWRDAAGLALTPVEQDYLQASISADTTQKQREAQQARYRRNLRRGLIGALMVGFVIALGLSIFAFSQQRIANEQRQEALRQASIGLAALAEKELGGIDRELSVLLALEAVEHYPFTSQAAGALALSIEEFRAFRLLDASDSVADLMAVAAWSPDGRRIAGGGRASPDSVIIWDVESGNKLLSVNTHEDLCQESVNLMYDLAWSPSGDRLAAISQDAKSGEACGTVVIDTASGETVLTIQGYDSASRSLDWSPDGATILTGHEDGAIRGWDAHSGEERTTLTGHTGMVFDAVFSPDGRRIASASEDGTVRLWDIGSSSEQVGMRWAEKHCWFFQDIRRKW
jgi:hypothetical protein